MFTSFANIKKIDGSYTFNLIGLKSPVVIKHDSKDISLTGEILVVSDKLCVMVDQILVKFLSDSTFFVSAMDESPFFKYPKDPSKKRGFSFSINLSDTFAYVCADSETVYYDQLEEVYAHWLADPVNGLTVWVIKQRRELPILPYINNIKERGIWDIDALLSK